MSYKKVVVGYVVQSYNDNGTPESQEFIAGDEVTYEDEFYGEPIDPPTEKEVYLPYDMVQPN